MTGGWGFLAPLVFHMEHKIQGSLDVWFSKFPPKSGNLVFFFETISTDSVKSVWVLKRPFPVWQKKKKVQQKTYSKFVSYFFLVKKVGSRTSNFMPNSVNILKRPRRNIYLQCIQTTNQKFHIFLRCPQTSETYMSGIMFPKKINAGRLPKECLLVLQSRLNFLPNGSQGSTL